MNGLFSAAYIICFSTHRFRIWGQKFQKTATSWATRALNEHFSGFSMILPINQCFFYFSLEIWLNNDMQSVFQPGESKFGVKNIKKWHLVGPHGPWMSILCIIKSNFENPNFSILISDLDCLQKSIIAKCSSFFHILIRT